MQPDRNASRCLSHHSVNDAVEHYFQLSGQIPPIAGSTDNQGMSFFYLFQYALCIIFRQATFQFLTATHAADARTDCQIGNSHDGYFVAIVFCFCFHKLKHLRDMALLAGTSVNNQNFHDDMIMRFLIAELQTPKWRKRE